MGAIDVLLIVGALTALGGFMWLWRNFPRRRPHLVIGSALLAGAAVFTVWWTMFRVDDPTFTADRDRALQQQEALDDGLGKDF